MVDSHASEPITDAVVMQPQQLLIRIDGLAGSVVLRSAVPTATDTRAAATAVAARITSARDCCYRCCSYGYSQHTRLHVVCCRGPLPTIAAVWVVPCCKLRPMHPTQLVGAPTQQWFSHPCVVAVVVATVADVDIVVVPDARWLLRLWRNAGFVAIIGGGAAMARIKTRSDCCGGDSSLSTVAARTSAWLDCAY